MGAGIEGKVAVAGGNLSLPIAAADRLHPHEYPLGLVWEPSGNLGKPFPVPLCPRRTYGLDQAMPGLQGVYPLLSTPGHPSIHDRAVDQLLDELAVVGAAGARRLAHLDADELLLRVDPEIGAGIPGPHEFAGRSRHAGDARRLGARQSRGRRCSRACRAEARRASIGAAIRVPRWSEVISAMVGRDITRAPSSWPPLSSICAKRR